MRLVLAVLLVTLASLARGSHGGDALHPKWPPSSPGGCTLSDGSPESVENLIRSEEFYRGACCLGPCSDFLHHQVSLRVHMQTDESLLDPHPFPLKWYPKACLARSPAVCGGSLQQCEEGASIYRLTSSPLSSGGHLLINDFNETGRVHSALPLACSSAACRTFASHIAYWQLHLLSAKLTKKAGESTVAALMDCACDQPQSFAEIAPSLEAVATLLNNGGKPSENEMFLFRKSATCCPGPCRDAMISMLLGFHLEVGVDQVLEMTCGGFNIAICPAPAHPPVPPSSPPQPSPTSSSVHSTLMALALGGGTVASLSVLAALLITRHRRGMRSPAGIFSIRAPEVQEVSMELGEDEMAGVAMVDVAMGDQQPSLSGRGASGRE